VCVSEHQSENGVSYVIQRERKIITVNYHNSGISLLGEIMINKELESRVDSLEKLVADSQAATQKSLQGLQQAVNTAKSKITVAFNGGQGFLCGSVTTLRLLISNINLRHKS